MIRISLWILGLLFVQVFGLNGQRHTPLGHRHDEKRVAVELAPGHDADELARSLGMRNLGEVVPQHFVFQTDDRLRRRRRKRDALEDPLAHVNATLSAHKGVRWYEHQTARQLAKRNHPYVVHDPLYKDQWHFHGTSVSLNTVPVWASGVFGKGVRVSIIDDGVQFTHPDVAAHFDEDKSFDFNDDDPDVTPHPKYDDHGTSAAGACCGVNNLLLEPQAEPKEAFCGVGVAPEARISAVRLIATSTEDYQEAHGIGYMAKYGNDVYSNSWGPTDDGRRLEGPGKLAASAREMAMQHGRNGLGPIYVWAAGNGRTAGDNCNYDGWANSRYALTIGSIMFDEARPWYSENCASMFGVTPSSGHDHAISTTDLLGTWGTSQRDCTAVFGGTSASAPLAAGVVALVLEVNPALTWRDVQGVFALSAQPVARGAPSWQTTGAGLRFSHEFGFGRVDAAAAVALAREWTNYAGVATHSSGRLQIDHALDKGATLYATWTCTAHHARVLHVELLMDVAHPHRGELEVRLKSPMGTVSELQDFHNDRNADIRDWTYVSVANWHEKVAGEWSVTIYNAPKTSGVWKAFEITVHTVDEPPEKLLNWNKAATAALTAAANNNNQKASSAHHHHS